MLGRAILFRAPLLYQPNDSDARRILLNVVNGSHHTRAIALPNRFPIEHHERLEVALNKTRPLLLDIRRDKITPRLPGGLATMRVEYLNKKLVRK